MPESYRVVIIDDEPLARQVIRINVLRHADMVVVGECSDGFEGLQCLRQQSPDVLFLDIQMPRMTGFELLELLENPPVTIFITAYDQYALQAFQVSAADYLLKPFNKARFDEALQRARLLTVDKPARQQQLTALRQQRDAEREPLRRIAVERGGRALMIALEHLLQIEAQDDYVLLHTTNGRFLKHKTMHFFEKFLPAQDFVRVHRSHIIRLAAIAEIKRSGRDSHSIVLQNGNTVPVSHSGYQRLKAFLQ